MHPFTEAEVEDFEHYFSRVIQEGENGVQIVEKPPITMTNWLRAHDDRVRADEQRRIREGIEEIDEKLHYQGVTVWIKRDAALSVITPEDTTSDKTKV